MGLWISVYWLTAGGNDDRKLLVAVGNAGLTLAFGGVLGGLIKKLFDAWSDRADHHAATQAFYRNILDDLKSVYDEVERARLLIEAHKSAKTYGEQMRTMPDAVIKLRNIERALTPGFEGLRAQLQDDLSGLIAFLNGLIDEFRAHYIEVSRLQSMDEAVNRNRRTEAAKDSAQAAKVEVSSNAWARIQTFERLKVLRLAQGPDETDPDFVRYKAAFLDHIDNASETLRRRLDGSDQS